MSTLEQYLEKAPSELIDVFKRLVARVHDLEVKLETLKSSSVEDIYAFHLKRLDLPGPKRQNVTQDTNDGLSHDDHMGNAGTDQISIELKSKKCKPSPVSERQSFAEDRFFRCSSKAIPFSETGEHITKPKRPDEVKSNSPFYPESGSSILPQSISFSPNISKSNYEPKFTNDMTEDVGTFVTRNKHKRYTETLVGTVQGHAATSATEHEHIWASNSGRDSSFAIQDNNLQQEGWQQKRMPPSLSAKHAHSPAGVYERPQPVNFSHPDIVTSSHPRQRSSPLQSPTVCFTRDEGILSWQQREHFQRKLSGHESYNNTNVVTMNMRPRLSRPPALGGAYRPRAPNGLLARPPLPPHPLAVNRAPTQNVRHPYPDRPGWRGYH
eukprot:gene118-3510_t